MQTFVCVRFWNIRFQMKNCNQKSASQHVSKTTNSNALKQNACKYYFQVTFLLPKNMTQRKIDALGRKKTVFSLKVYVQTMLHTKFFSWITYRERVWVWSACIRVAKYMNDQFDMTYLWRKQLCRFIHSHLVQSSVVNSQNCTITDWLFCLHKRWDSFSLALSLRYYAQNSRCRFQLSKGRLYAFSLLFFDESPRNMSWWLNQIHKVSLRC